AHSAVVLNRHQDAARPIERPGTALPVTAKVQLPAGVITETNEAGIGSAIRTFERKKSISVRADLQGAERRGRRRANTDASDQGSVANDVQTRSGLSRADADIGICSGVVKPDERVGAAGHPKTSLYSEVGVGLACHVVL